MSMSITTANCNMSAKIFFGLNYGMAASLQSFPKVT
jgi:hypothetical protein